MPQHPIATYIESIQEVHRSASGVKETSFYPALSVLFNTLGKPLKPPVYCVSILKNVGAGFPDGGFFTKSQNQILDKEDDEDRKKSLLKGTKPERGVLEVKGASQNLTSLIQSSQVKKYLDEYSLVLVTNLWQFALVDMKNGAAREIERFDLCADESELWSLNPQKIAESKGEECREFLTRCLLTGADLKTPQDVAAFLASYARQARLRLEATDLDTLDPLRQALEKALGVEFKAVDKPGKKLTETQKREQGERFFRATLVQTLFYGLFSAWLSHVKANTGEPFRWREAQYSLHVPMVATLFEELVKASNLKSLELESLVTLAAEMLNRVKTEDFFTKWDGAGAIQYFYEPFLERFDPILRKELGVYYTPPEIVQYMVERVHRVLKSELGIKKGLADEQVMILDPCCGTGAFVLETLRVIGAELEKNVPANRVAGKLKTAALERVFGFEILPAPFVVAHHGVSDLLKSYKATLKEDERAPIYLTNSLTGWAATPETPTFPYPGFKTEFDAAQKVKRQEKILVILGNPPYDAFAKIEEDPDLISPYKKGLFNEWGISRNYLQDLYVRFFRIAERKLNSGDKGVLCFISNHSWTVENSYVVMRQNLLDSFNSIWIENMHGNRKISERAPDGTTSETVFAIPGFSVGIKQGVTISTLVRNGDKAKRVLFNDNLTDARASARRKALLATLDNTDFESQYEEAYPTEDNWYRLRPRNVGVAYPLWPSVHQFPAHSPSLGLLENRQDSLIAMDKPTLESRFLQYFDQSVNFDNLHKAGFGFTKVFARFDPVATRQKAIARSGFLEDAILRYNLRAFDTRWCYYSDVRPLWNECRPWLASQLSDGNSFFVSRKSHVANPEGAPFYFTSALGSQDALRGHAYYFPLLLRREVLEELEPDENGVMLEKKRTETGANLSPDARAYLAELGFGDPDTDAAIASLIWLHALTIGYSRAYREEHADGLASDWPRVPLPSDAATLQVSAALGKQVAALLDMARPVEGIETGTFRRELEPFGLLGRRDGQTIEDGDAALRLSENWGFFGERGIVQPGTPRIIERVTNPDERAALEKLGLPIDTPMLDLPLNANAIWSGVPRPVWETIIGGYPVLKKWLSYRDERVLGRALRLDEAQEVENITRRLVALWALGEKLDANYQACAAIARPLVFNEPEDKAESL